MEPTTRHPVPDPPQRGAVPLSEDDLMVVEAARAAIAEHYRPHWHMVGAAVRGLDGRIWTGIHLGATVGRLQICAEAVALGRALLEGDGTAALVAAVRHPKPEEADRELAVVPPCGACREMLVDHCGTAQIVVPAEHGLVKVPVLSLLPAPYRR